MYYSREDGSSSAARSILNTSGNRGSLLSSTARVQAPWVKVTIGEFTFGVFDQTIDGRNFNVQYPNYIQGLTVTKINGQVNQYELSINYPITQNDDPNFFEKVFSSVSQTRKIVFTYGDATMPNYTYKDEEAIITSIGQSFNLSGSSISYTVKAVSGAKLATSGTYNFVYQGKKKPSDLIKTLFKQSKYGLQKVFTGMNVNNLDLLIEGEDRAVELVPKLNISILEYINYLVGCMVPDSAAKNNLSNEIYIMTIHDDTTYDRLYNPTEVEGNITGPYFKVSKTSSVISRGDAYEIDIGFNTSTIVTEFSLENNENYSILYNYQKELTPQEYVKRLNSDGKWDDIWAPTSTSANERFKTNVDDVVWWSKITKYPVTASITIQGLLRPAMLMTYLRLNTIFLGGHKHISSGLYIITKQVDRIDFEGYRTQLSMVKIEGDSLLQ